MLKSKGKPSLASASPDRPNTESADLVAPPEPSGCPIVGIGASAGGLEAFSELLGHLPIDTGMVFVLIQHLSPTHKSALPQILSKVSRLPVEEVTQDVRVVPNRVYVIPPDRNLTFVDETLKLTPRPATAAFYRSIDSFFESLAESRRERSIGVILSGTATDGTLGLEAIKAAGGITFAQDDSAKFDSMPRSAVAAGCVDLVLSARKIAEELGRIARHPFLRTAAVDPALAADYPRTDTSNPLIAADGSSPTDLGDQDYKKILEILRRHVRVDFTAYKPTTIQRRIRRRMVLNKLTSFKEYAAILPKNSAELDLLYADVLIHVTSFFRNPESFDALKQSVLSLFKPQNPPEKIRIWVPACSTGQEAFSVAMALAEAADGIPKAPELQIFATDINGVLLETARQALYSKAVLGDVSPERLRRFFVEEQGGYRICKPLRDLIVFAQQDLLNDPPFSRLDLICCRNVLIYLEPGVQKKIFGTFHYALKLNGLLFLGASESVAASPELFEPTVRNHKIYTRKAGPSPRLQFSAREATGRKEITAPRRLSVPDGFHGELDIQRESDRITLNRYAPSSVLINGDLQILEFRGDTSPWLKPPTGKAHFNLLKMAREGLSGPLREALEESKREGRAARRDNVPAGPDADGRPTSIEVIPLKNLKQACSLVFFEDAEKPPVRRMVSPDLPVPAGGNQSGENGIAELNRCIAELQQELHESHDFLQSFREQSDAAAQEAQGANEEVTSANEELQSVNEELETSKEEIESTNEELTTVNEELASRNTTLGQLNGDLTNLQSSINLAIVLLGRDQNIRRFSARAAIQFNLLSTDVGRPFGHIRHNLNLQDLDRIIGGVISTSQSYECELQSQDGRWYSLAVRPYISVDQKIDGAVLVLMDIDGFKRSQQEIASARDYAEAITRCAPDPLLVLTADLHVEQANPAFCAAFHVSPAEIEGRLIYSLGSGQWDTPSLRQRLDSVIADQLDFNDFTMRRDFAQIGRRTVVLSARRLGDRQPQKILLGIRDMTELLQFQAEIRRSELRYRRLFEAARDGVIIIDPATRKILDANPYLTELLGYTHDELVGKELFEIGLIQNEQAGRSAFGELQDKGFIRSENLPLQTKAGKLREVEMVSNLYDQEGEKVIQCNIRDITERKNIEQTLAETHAQLEAHAEELMSFNRVAVGRELRMIELKREINRLCQDLGQPPRFVLESEQSEKGTHD
jgi:two-component system CheB/CheR fusion protein